MAKRLVKKRKIRLFRFFLVMIILGLFVLLVYYFFNDNIKNIIIKNTSYLNDDYIIELANLQNYPSFWFTSSTKIKKRLKKSIYIEDVKIKKKFYNVLVLEIKENTPLFVYEGDQTIVFENKEKLKVEDEIDLFRVPRLMNYVPDTKYQEFIKGLQKIDREILGKVSEITYKPNDYDKDRFLLYMDDGNSVYLTLTKFKMLNYYNKVLTQLDDKKGILYLDSGNHFQIKE